MVEAFEMNGGNITILFCCIEDLKQTLICVASNMKNWDLGKSSNSLFFALPRSLWDPSSLLFLFSGCVMSDSATL